MNIKFALIRDTLVYLRYIKACTDKEPKELAGSLLNSYAALIEKNLQVVDQDQIQDWEALKEIITNKLEE